MQPSANQPAALADPDVRLARAYSLIRGIAARVRAEQGTIVTTDADERSMRSAPRVKGGEHARR